MNESTENGEFFLADRDPRAGQEIHEHKIHVTMLADEHGQQAWFKAYTLPELAELVKLSPVTKGVQLKYLKLAVFGPTKDVEGCLITAANAQQISGIEVEYAGSDVSPKQAAEILCERNVRGMIFVMPGENGWTILLPLSKPHQQVTFWQKQQLVVFRELPEVRELLVARVNGLFGGKLSPESFDIQHPIAFGNAVASILIEGEFLDINDYTSKGSIFRDGSTVMDRDLREQRP